MKLTSIYPSRDASAEKKPGHKAKTHNANKVHKKSLPPPLSYSPPPRPTLVVGGLFKVNWGKVGDAFKSAGNSFVSGVTSVTTSVTSSKKIFI